MAAAEVLASWGAALAALNSSAGSKTCLQTCESFGPGSLEADSRQPDHAGHHRPDTTRRLSFPQSAPQDALGDPSRTSSPLSGRAPEAAPSQSSSNPHYVLGSAICLTALVHAGGKEEAAAGQQLLACINALPLCGGQAALPITQSFVGQLVALMLHLNRVLASPSVAGDLKRGISTAMLRLLAHSAGLIDSLPGSHSSHSPGADSPESVTPRAAGEWPISAPLRAAVAKIALGHQCPIEQAPTDSQAAADAQPAVAAENPPAPTTGQLSPAGSRRPDISPSLLGDNLAGPGGAARSGVNGAIPGASELKKAPPRFSAMSSDGVPGGGLLDSNPLDRPGTPSGGWGSAMLQHAGSGRHSPGTSVESGSRSRRASADSNWKVQKHNNRNTAIELLLEIAQAALSLALQGIVRPAVPMQVVASCLMSLQPVLAAEPSIPANTYALISGVVAMAGSLADNADRQASGQGGGEPWLWDLFHNLAPPMSGSRAPRSQHFPSPEQVCRMALEAACGLLEAAWSSGQVAAVEAALLPLQALGGSTSLDRPPSFSSPCQQQALVLLTGRLVTQLQGQEQLLQVALPMLVAAWNNSMAVPPVYACLAHTLATVGIVCAKSDQRWAFEQGALAKSLALLGEACCTLNASYRLELESRLLALFAKMGFAASSTASEQTSAADLASLVSAIATTRPLSQAGSPEVQGLQGALLADTVLSRCRSEDTQLVKAHRVLWLYIAVFDLAGLAGEAAPASRRRQEAVRAAIGRLAASAPICLLVGLQASSERLEAELWERLQFLGRLGTSKSLLASLRTAMGGYPFPQPATQSPAWLAHLLITAYANRCQAVLAPPATNPQNVPVWPLLFQIHCLLACLQLFNPLLQR
ncbi:hypothetical protein WJX84_004092 [Apatococcus fuscideae]|uniref:Protein MON2 homolog n=1 Tax=Apatococcus fuscideae TaxID=2026836 RepID=A0AAW1SXG1_9CHLO